MSAVTQKPVQEMHDQLKATRDCYYNSKILINNIKQKQSALDALLNQLDSYRPEEFPGLREEILKKKADLNKFLENTYMELAAQFGKMTPPLPGGVESPGERMSRVSNDFIQGMKYLEQRKILLENYLSNKSNIEKFGNPKFSDTLQKTADDFKKGVYQIEGNKTINFPNADSVATFNNIVRENNKQLPSQFPTSNIKRFVNRVDNLDPKRATISGDNLSPNFKTTKDRTPLSISGSVLGALAGLVPGILASIASWAKKYNDSGIFKGGLSFFGPFFFVAGLAVVAVIGAVIGLVQTPYRAIRYGSQTGGFVEALKFGNQVGWSDPENFNENRINTMNRINNIVVTPSGKVAIKEDNPIPDLATGNAKEQAAKAAAAVIPKAKERTEVKAEAEKKSAKNDELSASLTTANVALSAGKLDGAAITDSTSKKANAKPVIHSDTLKEAKPLPAERNNSASPAAIQTPSQENKGKSQTAATVTGSDSNLDAALEKNKTTSSANRLK